VARNFPEVGQIVESLPRDTNKSTNTHRMMPNSYGPPNVPGKQFEHHNFGWARSMQGFKRFERMLLSPSHETFDIGDCAG